jgi:diguanylate cyclase (GGDEF)-like protein/PAS domain S-box-containing protein
VASKPIREATEPGERPEQTPSHPTDGRRITAQELEEALERERGLLRTMIDSLPAKIYAKDAESRFIACNWPVAREMGSTPAEVIGKTDFDFFPRDMAEGFFADEQAVIRSGRPLIDREEQVLDQITGQTREISTTKVPFRDRAGNVIGIVGIGRDITERKRYEERIRHLATHDPLTDLPNRSLFSERLNASLREASTASTRFALLFVDLDRFKFINDSLGHEAGDSLLKQTAARLRNAVHSADIVARLGGDEFVLLCREVGELADVDAFASKILHAVIAPVVLLDQECRVSASIGVAIYPDDGETERTLMKSADTAMYTAKQDGKNNYRRFIKGMNAESLERAMLENELRRSIERRELLVHYLPKFDLKSRAITGAEALLRWSHPDLGLIPPRRFLPIAEESGLIVPIGNWVLKTVCAQHMAWRQQGLPPMCVSVNLTWRQFNDEQFVATVLAALQESGMSPAMLELEFSEQLLLQHAARSSQVLRELKRAGVRLAVDNFGASYLSLASIQKFPIDTLKVDRSLLREIDDAQSAAITDAIVAVAKSLSLTVIAEGVETVRQAAFAQEHACDAMQGFYVSEPTGAEGFADLLRRQLQMKLQNPPAG